MPDSCDGSHERGGRRTSTSTDCGDRFGSLMAVRAARIITNPSQEVTSLYINGVVAARETCQGPYAAAAAARNWECGPERGDQKKKRRLCPSERYTRVFSVGVSAVAALCDGLDTLGSRGCRPPCR